MNPATYLSEPFVGRVVELNSRGHSLPGEVKLHLGACSEKQRRFVLSLGSLLSRDKGQHFKAVLRGEATIGADVDGNAIIQSRIQS